MIPTISSPSVKNGEQLRIQAVIKAAAGVAKAEAVIDGMTTLELTPAPLNSGGVNQTGQMGLYQAQWKAKGLEKKIYPIKIRVTDKAGHVFTDTSLSFSDPAAGLSTPGTQLYPNGGMREIGTATGLPAEGAVESAVIDPANGYAYFGTGDSPGVVIKVALNSGINPPTQVGAVQLNTGENDLTSAVIDPANGYAYFGTFTTPVGFVVKVALGSGTNPPERVAALPLLSGEAGLISAVIDPTAGYAYFGTATIPGNVVKVALGSGNAAPTRVGVAPFNAGRDFRRCRGN